MTQRKASPKRPSTSQSTTQFPIACHGAIKFLKRKTNISTKQNVFVCDSGCRSKPTSTSKSGVGMKRAAHGFIQILDYDPIPLCAKCLKEAKLALAEIEAKIVVPPN